MQKRQGAGGTSKSMVEARKVYFDNNFFDHWLISHQDQGKDFAGRFRSAGWVWCLSDDLLRELLVPGNERFVSQYMQCFLPLLAQSLVCRNAGQVVREELRGQRVQPFEFHEALTPLRGFLEEIASGNFSRMNRIWSLSDQWRNSDQQLKRELEHARQRGARRLKLERFLFLKIRQHLISLQVENPEEEANRMLSNLHMFPHLRTHSMVAYELSYRSFRVQGMCDLRHLVHAVDADVLVTDDKWMKEIAEQLFHGNPMVWTREVFFKALN